MKNSTKIIIGFVAVIVVIIAGVLFVNNQKEPIIEKTAYEKLSDSMEGQLNIKKVDMDMTFDMSLESEDTSLENVSTTLNDVKFKYNIKQDIEDIEKPLVEGLFSIMYLNESALDLSFFINDQEMIFALPEILDKQFVLSFEDYTSYMNSIMKDSQIPASTLNFKEMIKKSYEFQKKLYTLEGIEGAESFDKDKYNEIIENGLTGILSTIEPFDVTINDKDKNSIIKCDGFLLSFNETQFIDFLIPILEEAKTDESVKNIIISKLEDFKNFSMDLYGTDFIGAGNENPYAEINETIDNIKQNYESGISDLIVQLKEQREKSEEEIFTVTNKIGLDEEGTIRYWNMSLEINNSILETMSKDNNAYVEGSELTKVNKVTINSETIINSYNQDIEFKDYSNIDEMGIKIVDLIKNPSAPETQQIIMQLYGALMQEMATNPLFQVISQEMGVY